MNLWVALAIVFIIQRLFDLHPYWVLLALCVFILLKIGGYYGRTRTSGGRPVSDDGQEGR